MGQGAQTTTGRFRGPPFVSSIIAALRAASRPTVGSTRRQPTNGRLYP